mmetsp:Transcript_45155/g.118493  ORF Transcript_45155/g.118493 Transcript_45155/m.118493 type:complete len:99 (-) Transcript_45155:122-418(-)
MSLHLFHSLGGCHSPSKQLLLGTSEQHTKGFTLLLDTPAEFVEEWCQTHSAYDATRRMSRLLALLIQCGGAAAQALLEDLHHCFLHSHILLTLAFAIR